MALNIFGFNNKNGNEEKEEKNSISSDFKDFKCKSKLNDNGSVTFWPTPNCEPSTHKLKSGQISMDAFLADVNCSAALCYSDPKAQIVQEGKTCSFLVSALL